MFFRKDYAAPGPGVDPDEPEKTGVARLVEILSLECGTLVKLNLLFLVSCLPVVTIPPAIFAMNQVTRMMILDRPVLCWYHYTTTFRRFWRRGYAAFAAVMAPLVFSGCGVWFYLGRAATNPILFLPFMLCSTVFLLTLLASSFFYGLLTTGRNVGECLRLALILGGARPHRAVPAALAVYGTLGFAVLALPLSGIYLLLIGFSLPCLLAGFFIRTEYPLREKEEDSDVSGS